MVSLLKIYFTVKYLNFNLMNHLTSFLEMLLSFFFRTKSNIHTTIGEPACVYIIKRDTIAFV